jgi:two-component system, OmpR family, phosphate regulon sensor histidine kinase PhoR
MTSPIKDQVSIIVSDSQAGGQLERVILSQVDCTVSSYQDHGAFLKTALQQPPSLLIVTMHPDAAGGLNAVHEIHKVLPALPVLLMVDRTNPEVSAAAMRAGIYDLVTVPLRSEEFISAIRSCLKRWHDQVSWIQHEANGAAADLQRRVDELETLVRLGRSVTSSLNIDSVLSSVVDAAVELTGAEEGSLLLLDEESGELYMRASRNFNSDFARTFRMPIRDTLVGSVLSSGQPVLLDEKTPQKIKTSYLVHSLLYVPLKLRGKTFGVLGVDNRVKRKTFLDRDVQTLLALAEYAAIALDNAGMYFSSTQELNKLSSIIGRIQDGVLVIDSSRRLLIVNDTVISAFELQQKNLIGHPFHEVFNDTELLRLVETLGKSLSNQAEVSVPDGRVFSAVATEIPDVGAAITFHDITYLKKLDRIKSDFVGTVSHDLRSPLTAIMGYVELIERSGPVNERQQEYIRRVLVNVQNITGLMNDLLNLGHIESGFDSSKETLFLDQIIRFSVENNSRAAASKQISLDLVLPDRLPPMLANPVQMRQMLDNLVDNAIKYSPEGGKVSVMAVSEMDQLILQVSDTGYGITAVDLPYIFDKFYRGSNVATVVAGTGLGLSIVKSIIENHNGRIWVDSTPGKGSVFTVVLPVAKGAE